MLAHDNKLDRGIPTVKFAVFTAEVVHGLPLTLLERGGKALLGQVTLTLQLAIHGYLTARLLCSKAYTYTHTYSAGTRGDMVSAHCKLHT